MGGIVAFLIIFLLFTVVSLQLVNIYYPPTVTIGTPNSVTDVITAPGPAPEVAMEQTTSTDPRDYQGATMPLDSSYGWWGGEDNWLSSLNDNMNTLESALLGSNTRNTGNVTPIDELIVRRASNASGFLDLALHPYE
jgi:hypothetical protein